MFSSNNSIECNLECKFLMAVSYVNFTSAFGLREVY